MQCFLFFASPVEDAHDIDVAIAHNRATAPSSPPLPLAVTI